MKKISPQELFLISSGVILIIVGVLGSEPIIASMTEDGEIGSRMARLVLWAASIFFVLLGIAAIFGRKSANLFRLVMMLAITIMMFVVLDYALYFAAPVLPEPFVRLMSPRAQLRYFEAHEAEIPWVYEENFRYARPGVETLGITTDEYGYRNPTGYQMPGEPVDILLIGDSFTWGTADTTIADFMRAEWSGQTVYSAGVFGNSISQWSHHYADYVERIGGSPEVVVFNLYSGNDLSDTQFFARIQGFGRAEPAITYFTFYNFPFLVPAEPGGFAIPKLPELASITMSLLAGGDQLAAEPIRLETDYAVDEAWPISHEPLTEEFTPEILAELDLVIDEVRATSPDTTVIVSYIPTITGVYGALLTDCEWCDFDIEQQARNSMLLAEHLAGSGAHFVDVTPTLQTAAQSTPMWAPDGHFSEAGYGIYAVALGKAVAEIQALE